MSSTTISSERQIRATTRETEPSTLARPIVAVSDSRLNQATPQPGLDRGGGEALEVMGLAGARWAGEDEVLGSPQPFERAQRVLGRRLAVDREQGQVGPQVTGTLRRGQDSSARVVAAIHGYQDTWEQGMSSAARSRPAFFVCSIGRAKGARRSRDCESHAGDEQRPGK